MSLKSPKLREIYLAVAGEGKLVLPNPHGLNAPRLFALVRAGA